MENEIEEDFKEAKPDDVLGPNVEFLRDCLAIIRGDTILATLMLSGVGV